MVVVIAYLLMGFLWDLWSVGWTLFLLIPIVPSIFHAIRTKKATRFAYPVFVTFIYLTLGMTIGYWHPLWVLFLTIPIYYTIFGEIEKAKREKTN